MLKIILMCVLAAMFVLAAPITTHGRQLAKHHNISVEVECITAAMGIIDELNGHNMDSVVHFDGPYSQGSANITRRVDDWAFRHVQEVLRGLGEVLSESENARYLGAELMYVETRIAVLSQEMERLTLMLAASDSVEVLIAVNDRLSRVSRERDFALGRRNVLMNDAGSSLIHIHLFSEPLEPPPRVPTSFGERVANSFVGSWHFTLRTAGHLLVFTARVALPAAIWTVIGVVAYFVIKKFRSSSHVTQEVNHGEE